MGDDAPLPIKRRGSQVVYTASKGAAKHVCSFRYIYFHVIPLFLSIAVSLEVWYLASNRETKEAVEAFDRVCENIIISVQLAWKLTVIQPDFLVALYFSTNVPTQEEFESFTMMNPHWNLAGTITEVEWVPQVKDSDRVAFETEIRKNRPDFRIWNFGSNTSHDFYCPITYNPTGTSVLGLDLCNDPIEGPIIRSIARTGNPTSAQPFLLRGLPAGTEFKMGTTLYMPLFRDTSNSKLTTLLTSEYVGCVVTVIHFQPLLNNILKYMDLKNLDIFLFDAATLSYLAHYESGPESSMPAITYSDAKYLTPANITGDLVSDFTSSFNIPAIDRTYRLVVRARSGNYINHYKTILPVILLLISLFVKFFDKLMVFIESKIYKPDVVGRVRNGELTGVVPEGK